MKTILTTGWHFMRIVRLVLGIIWMIFAYMQHDGLIGLAGGFLVFTALFNYGCCGSNGCPKAISSAGTTNCDIES